MEVKIDTKERFHVITLMQENLAANLAAELSQVVTKFLQDDVKNVVVKLDHVTSVDEDAATALASLQQNFYEQNASFVICGLQDQVEQQLDEMELLEIMNVTPSESEAWDIVQMEEIERELLDGDDVTFAAHDDN